MPTLVSGIVSSIGIQNLSANVLKLTSVKLVSNQTRLDYYTFSATAETSVCNTHIILIVDFNFTQIFFVLLFKQFQT